MIICNSSFEVLDFPDNALEKIADSARICYKSEPKNEKSNENLVRKLIKLQHFTPLEHCSITVKIICDRAIMCELTRHRLASFNIESTRYCNYSKKGLTFIKPCFWDIEPIESEKWNNGKTGLYQTWLTAMYNAEKAYKALIESGATPEQARSVLPNSLKTDIIITANIREWLHIFNLRCSKASHPQMREIMIPILKEFYKRLPVVFEDIYNKYHRE